jgi:hypothetical protein
MRTFWGSALFWTSCKCFSHSYLIIPEAILILYKHSIPKENKAHGPMLKFKQQLLSNVLALKS